ncbi:hypothetical protein COOONC_04788, partial [Cooperia oncophora]
WKIYLALNKKTYSTQTKLSVKQLVQALTLQSLVPLVTIFPAAGVYLVVQFDAVDERFPSYIVVPCLSIGEW